jgi:hypothetical protein
MSVAGVGLEALHFFLQAQFFEFEAGEGAVVGSGAAVFLQDSGIQAGVAFLQNFDVRL